MQQISTKTRDPLGIVKEIEILPYEPLVYTQPRICPGERYTRTPLGFCNTNGSSNLGQTTRPCDSQQKKGNLPNCGLCFCG